MNKKETYFDYLELIHKLEDVFNFKFKLDENDKFITSHGNKSYKGLYELLENILKDCEKSTKIDVSTRIINNF